MSLGYTPQRRYKVKQNCTLFRILNNSSPSHRARIFIVCCSLVCWQHMALFSVAMNFNYPFLSSFPHHIICDVALRFSGWGFITTSNHPPVRRPFFCLSVVALRKLCAETLRTFSRLQPQFQPSDKASPLSVTRNVYSFVVKL